MKRSARGRAREPGGGEARALPTRREAQHGGAFGSWESTPLAAPRSRPGLTLGAVGSFHEQEAERVAGKVMGMGAPREGLPRGWDLPIEVPRILPEPGELAVRRSVDPQPGAGGGVVAPQVESGITASRGRGSPLPAGVRDFMEPRFGMDFGHVRVHADATADRLAHSLNARAFTTGGDVFFRQGQYAPDSVAGRSLLAHELTHVAQDPGPVIHRVIWNDAPVWTQDNGRAGTVEVENIHGTPLGPGANQPSVDPPGWQALMAAGHTLGNVGPVNTHYNAVRMHLWNGRLDGPGNDARNLAPGPAQVNSSMSAGPEEAAKNAVAAGRRIWLRTEVTYQNNVVNPADFTSVIPNHMEMEWGLMLQNGNRGPAQPPAWAVDIDQPAGAMAAATQQQFQAVGSTAALDALLVNVSLQHKTQAYGLVPDAYKSHLLLNHPQVYLALEDGQEAALLRMSAAETQALLAALALPTTATQVDTVLRHLYDHTAELQAVFNLFSQADKLRYAAFRDGEMLEPLEDVGEALAMGNWALFSLYAADHQYDLLDIMSEADITGLLGNRLNQGLLDGWAEDRVGSRDLDAMEAFIAGRLPSMADRYRDAHQYERQGLAHAQQMAVQDRYSFRKRQKFSS